MKTLLTSFSLGVSAEHGARGAGPDPADRRLRPSAPPARPPATAPATTAKATVSSDYRLVPGDKLRDRGLQGRAAVAERAGPSRRQDHAAARQRRPAAGRTPTELRDAIVTSLKTYISNPTVTVMVVETVPPVIYVMGEVNTAGPQPLTGKVDVLQALATAEGLHATSPTRRTS